MALSKDFLTIYANISDPRKATHNTRHKLMDILVITFLGVICGADSWTEIEEFGQAKYDWLKTFLILENGIPSHDTFGNLFARLNPRELQTAFLTWVQSLITLKDKKIIPIDGKTVRRSYDKAQGKGAIHMVSAWCSENQMVLGQLKTAEKSNEITAIPELLGMIDIENATITIDAMGCQKAIAKKVIEKKGNYVLAVKGNQRILHKDIYSYWDNNASSKDENNSWVDYHETLDKDHGRVEVRRYWCSSELEDLSTCQDWPGLKKMGMVESERHIGDKISVERRYYILSEELCAKEFAHAVRTHWEIENKLHWSLDVTFREDECRIRKGNAPENMSIIRQLALSMLKAEKSAKVGLKIKRSKAGWNNKYLMKVLKLAEF